MENTVGATRDSSFTCVMELDRQGVSSIPQRYVLPSSQQPNPNVQISNTIPIIDLSSLQDQSLRSRTLHDIRAACQELGVFLVINHGIDQSIMDDALEAATEFFDLHSEEKMKLYSEDVNKPVRYDTSFNHEKDKILCWRDFIKLYSHPLSDWIHLWPSNPPNYREKMGKFAKATLVLQKHLRETVFESIGLNPNYLEEELDVQGSQVLALNCYPACPEPEQTLGILPHSDFGLLTVLLLTGPGLEFEDSAHNWARVPFVEGALVVQLGDQMEIVSNGLCKSVIHRVTVNRKVKRLSIGSFHGFGKTSKVGPAPKLVDDHRPKFYSEFSFQEYLDFISSKSHDISEGRFIDTVRVKR
ncbi:flavanone 3-dioxygenase 3-like [Prosopis cineraria]|uniref:flavanone 3-dioxygenase 3-like n=1 Tax=Prosopis cineraria TaxID=364024 RepID=UPI00240F7A3D|nr:flavanone 3-dioxygenase 3-like [Prosopis cineraria]